MSLFPHCSTWNQSLNKELTFQSWWCWSGSAPLRWQRENPRCRDGPCWPSYTRPLRSETSSSVCQRLLGKEQQFSAERNKTTPNGYSSEIPEKNLTADKQSRFVEADFLFLKELKRFLRGKQFNILKSTFTNGWNSTKYAEVVRCSRCTAAAYIQVSLVDLVDDLQVSGQQLLQQLHRPALQSLGQNRVVGVGKGPAGQVPGLQKRNQNLSQDFEWMEKKTVKLLLLLCFYFLTCFLGLCNKKVLVSPLYLSSSDWFRIS